MSSLIDTLPLPILNNAGNVYERKPIKNPHNAIDIIKHLIEIHSFETENLIDKWIAGFVLKHAPTNFIPYRLHTDTKGRDSIIVSNSSFPNLIVLSHIDTALPWKVGTNPGDGKYDPFKATIKNGKLYGRGASDQKAGVGVLLSTLAAYKKTNIQLPPIMIGFISKEETDFGGMHALVGYFKKNYKKNPQYQPKFILSTGSDQQLGWQCRGVITLKIEFKGKTGHAAQPSSTSHAVNAYECGTETLLSVSKRLYKLKPTALGHITYNLASALSGIELADGTINLGHENQVPDYLSVHVEFRSNGCVIDGEKITVSSIIALIKHEAKKRRLEIKSVSIINDLPVWQANRRSITWFETLLKQTLNKNEIHIWDAALHGYDDMAILHSALSRNNSFNIPAAIWGIGKGKMFHQPDEYVEIDKIQNFERILTNLFTSKYIKS